MLLGMPERTDPALADELVAAVRTFVAKEVIPVASDLEHADAYPDDLVVHMKDMGLFGSTIATEYGGLGLDVVTYARIVEEMAFGWMSLTGILNTHMIAATLLKLHGTDEQQKQWLPRMATGELRGCLSLSEPDAGSDTRALRCKASPASSSRSSPARASAASLFPRRSASSATRASRRWRCPTTVTGCRPAGSSVGPTDSVTACRRSS